MSNKYRWGFFLVLALLGASNLAWFYSVVDQGITVTHHADAFARVQESRRTLADLVTHSEIGIDRSYVVAAAEALEERDDIIVKWEDETLFVDDIGFDFDGDNLETIRFMNDPAHGSD